MSDETKLCTTCSKFKPVSDFHKNKTQKDGYARKCKQCVKEYDQARNASGLYRSQRNIANRRYRYRNQYGLTYSQVLDILDAQDYKCKICGVDEESAPRNILHIDHDHLTGKIRGALCQQCNTGLGQFMDDTDLLIRAIAYLRGDR